LIVIDARWERDYWQHQLFKNRITKTVDDSKESA
jgi:hypothetical protein